MPRIELSPQVFVILSGLIEERAGLHYDLLDRDLLAEKVSPRAAELGFDSLLDYYYFLRYDPGGEEELDLLVESLVVHETYFFREADQLRLLADHLLPPVIAEGRRPRVWCAACATGEEPLTLALLLAERGRLDQVDILATDVSARVLARAQTGRYSARSVQAIPPPLFDRWFQRFPDGALPAPELRARVRWQRVNLIDDKAVAALGRFDAILCRNVLIYFRDATARHVVAQLADALHPGGHLLVGASESLLRFGTSLSFEEHGGSFYYRKVS